MAHALSALALLCLCSVAYSFISTDNGGKWGTWGPVDKCPYGYIVKGVSLKVEQPQGAGDDTGVNGVRLHCFHVANSKEVTIQSTVSKWGSWGPMVKCRSGYVVSYQIKVEPHKLGRDDTALNSIRIKCSTGEQLEANGGQWGTYGSWSNLCRAGVCGISTKVEKLQGPADDSALNDVVMHCCNE